MRDTFLRMLTNDKEKNILHQLIVEDTKAGYRVKIILLKDNGCTVAEIRWATNYHHDSNNIRKWIHHFNEKGIDGIISKIHKHKPIKITDDIKKKDHRDSSQKFKKRLWIAIFIVVITCTDLRIHYQRDKPS